MELATFKKHLLLHRFMASCFVFTVLAAQAAAQDTTAYTRQIKFTPIKMIDLINPGIEFTYEQKISKRFALQGGAAYLHDFLGLNTYLQYNGIRLLAEGKYLIPVLHNFSFYTGADLTYNYSAAKDKGTFERPSPGYQRNTYEDTFMVLKNTMSLNLKAGFMIYYHHFVADFAMGLGVKYRDARITGRQHPDDRLYRVGPDINIRTLSERAGASCVFNMPMTIRLGYCF